MAKKPDEKPVPVLRIALIASAVGMALLIALFAYNRLERFLIRDSRFALNEDNPTLEIAGAAHASRRQIEAVFAEDLGRSVYLMPLSERRTTLKTVDWVKDASIARLWPNRVIVSISERKPVAFVTLGSSKFALIDEDGIILPPATDRFPVPVLAGVRASDAIVERRDRVHRMLRLTRELGAHASKVSEVDVSDRDNLKITQSYDGRMLTLLLGDHNFGLRYENFLRNYGEIKRRLPDATTLDLRLEDRITVVEQ